MTKQEFLAMSLPYGLKFIGAEHTVFTMDGFYPPNSLHFSETNRYDYFHFNEKPILYPLSDLTKEIQHNGLKIVPLSEIIEDERCNSDVQHLSRMILNMDMKELCLNYPFWVVQKLVEWHFDVALLIEKGQAVNINMFSLNPYA